MFIKNLMHIDQNTRHQTLYETLLQTYTHSNQLNLTYGEWSMYWQCSDFFGLKKLKGPASFFSDKLSIQWIVYPMEFFCSGWRPGGRNWTSLLFRTAATAAAAFAELAPLCWTLSDQAPASHDDAASDVSAALQDPATPGRVPAEEPQARSAEASNWIRAIGVYEPGAPRKKS